MGILLFVTYSSSFFLYLKDKEFDSFLLNVGIQCFLAFLLFRQNFFLNYSYFVLFYTILFSFFSKRYTQIDILLSIFFLLIGYYIYGGILYFLLQNPLIFSRWFHILLSSLLFNLSVTFFIFLFFVLTKKKR